MAELLFILTTVYVAYVVYKVTDERKIEKQVANSTNAPTILTPTEIAAPAEAEVSSPAAQEPPGAAEANTVSSNNLRDPVSGETAKVTNNYRSLKRWLKEALVTEGLLDKVYHNSELNDETNAKIKDALEKIKTLSKYHA
jgi:hypothetical protein